MTRPVLWLLLAVLIIGAGPAGAADAWIGPRTPAVVVPPPEPPVVVVEEPLIGIGKMPKPLLGPPPPQIRYGCRRIWRCDATVCEWRRGCWGVYGYVESPYYTAAFARRQWEGQGLPAPRELRRRKRNRD